MAADSPIQFHSDVYCPPTNLENLGFARLEHGLNLCAKRVLVQSDCKELVPEYLRFLRGLVDSEDLPLNVSRETLQDNSVIRKIRTSLVKGVLDRLDHLAQDDADKFRAFYEQFGRALKEGLVVDPVNKERIAKLLRFPSSRSDDPGVRASFDEYLARMPEGQKRIYYLAGNDLAAVAKSPNLEIFRRKGLEVVFLTDPIDEFAVNSLHSYQGKDLTSIDSADLDLPDTGPTIEPAPSADENAAKESGFNRVLELFRTALGNRVREVRESKRLTNSPCCLVNAEGGMSTQMQRILKMANKDFTESARILEINPSAPLVRRLCRLSANQQHDDFIKTCALRLWTNAMILDGLTPIPEDMVARVQSFIMRNRRDAIAAYHLTSVNTLLRAWSGRRAYRNKDAGRCPLHEKRSESSSQSSCSQFLARRSAWAPRSHALRGDASSSRSAWAPRSHALRGDASSSGGAVSTVFPRGRQEQAPRGRKFPRSTGKRFLVPTLCVGTSPLHALRGNASSALPAWAQSLVPTLCVGTRFLFSLREGPTEQVPTSNRRSPEPTPASLNNSSRSNTANGPDRPRILVSRDYCGCTPVSATSWLRPQSSADDSLPARVDALGPSCVAASSAVEAQALTSCRYPEAGQ